WWRVCGGECGRDGAGAELAHGARLERRAPARPFGAPSALCPPAHTWSRTIGKTDATGQKPLTKFGCIGRVDACGAATATAAGGEEWRRTRRNSGKLACGSACPGDCFL
ncbi:hypothetical protein GWI33_013101, partial [Rhynchophorus ferrugineus]